MTEQDRNVAMVRAYLGAIEAFDIEAAGKLLHPEVVQTEKPNKLYAAGQVRRREDLLRDLPRGAKVLRSQRYPITSIVADADRVVVESKWEGVVNVPLGRLLPGDTMVAHICMIFRLAEQMIIEQTNYDCYEEFAAIT